MCLLIKSQASPGPEGGGEGLWSQCARQARGLLCGWGVPKVVPKPRRAEVRPGIRAPRTRPPQRSEADSAEAGGEGTGAAACPGMPPRRAGDRRVWGHLWVAFEILGR